MVSESFKDSVLAHNVRSGQMNVPFQYGSGSFEIELPDGSEIFGSTYPRSSGLAADVLRELSVNPHSAQAARVAELVQRLVDTAVGQGASVAAFPEGPYCVPVSTHN
jgi:hypothetical protein